jgi:hypothetical protein
MNELLYNIKSQVLVIIGIIIAFLSPIGPLLITVGLAIIADTIFGLIKAYKRKQAITSRRMSALISKLFLYQFVVVGVYIIDKYLVGELIGLFTDVPLLGTKLVAMSLLSIEVISINENIKAGFGINIWQSLKTMLARAKEVKQDLGELTEGVNDDNKE